MSKKPTKKQVLREYLQEALSNYGIGIRDVQSGVHQARKIWVSESLIKSTVDEMIKEGIAKKRYKNRNGWQTCAHGYCYVLYFREKHD